MAVHLFDPGWNILITFEWIVTRAAKDLHGTQGMYPPDFSGLDFSSCNTTVPNFDHSLTLIKC